MFTVRSYKQLTPVSVARLDWTGLDVYFTSTANICSVWDFLLASRRSQWRWWRWWRWWWWRWWDMWLCVWLFWLEAGESVSCPDLPGPDTGLSPPGFFRKQKQLKDQQSGEELTLMLGLSVTAGSQTKITSSWETSCCCFQPALHTLSITTGPKWPKQHQSVVLIEQREADRS